MLQLDNSIFDRGKKSSTILNNARRLFAKALELANVPIVLIDTNIENIIAAKEMGLTTKHSSILSQKIKDEIDISPKWLVREKG